ncbi:Cyclin-dependent kinase 9 [Pseudolycoriella hygida]|uniref:Cyclin-dependent kinase 9 n=1 Tax=Pseudolycoriella hygida TaxID=35572 RepID=A0A9Q0S3V2_9DIPT|nr:Cyclin-dependent kinase 9 [Pseudolycoriella hygida]
MASGRGKYLETCFFSQSTEASKYITLEKIGQGNFSEVFKAREKGINQKIVAMKRMLTYNEKDGPPISVLREVRLLQHLKHENIVSLIGTCCSSSSFYLVFEFCEYDLEGLLKNTKVNLRLGELKNVLQQLLKGLYHVHSKKISHRDVNPANVLITKNGILKLADFGSARAFCLPEPTEPQNRYTNPVVTLWYRSPELLLGDRNYGPSVDMWGAGCIMAEMCTRSPILRGNTEQEQIKLISQLCGSFTPDVWPGIVKLKLYNEMELPMGHNRKVKDRLKGFVRNAYGCELLDKLLQLDPNARIDADSALKHDFFWTHPMPSDLSDMISRHRSSMFYYSAPRTNQMKRPYQEQIGNNQIQNKRQYKGYEDRIY